jgi:hypothetical protein
MNAQQVAQIPGPGGAIFRIARSYASLASSTCTAMEKD